MGTRRSRRRGRSPPRRVTLRPWSRWIRVTPQIHQTRARRLQCRPGTLFAHEIEPPQLFAPFLEVLRHPIRGVLLQKTSIGIAGARLFHLADNIARIEMIED